MSSWKDDGQIWDRSSGQRGKLHFDKRCCSLQNLCETQRAWCALHMFVWSQLLQNLYDRSLLFFVWLLLAFVCMIAACVVVSTIRISRFQMQTGFDWSFPSIHQDIRIILVFRSAVVTVVDAIFNVQPCLLKFGGDCDGHQVHPFLLKCCGDCGRAAVTTFDICQPDLYEGLSPESASIWDFSLSLARWVHRGGW